MIGRRRLHPDDPPPDLAIETSVASKTKLDAYEAIAVPELWIFDGGKAIAPYRSVDFNDTRLEKLNKRHLLKRLGHIQHGIPVLLDEVDIRTSSDTQHGKQADFID